VISKSNFFRWTVPPSEAGIRLDVYLSRRLTSQSRSHLKALILSGHVKVGGKCSKASRLLRAEEKIVLEIPAATPLDVPSQDLPIDILYEDKHLLVLNKAAEQVVHPGAGIREGTVVNALLHHCRDLSGIGGVLRPGIVHRLDKGTSGLMVVAKEDGAHRGLAQQFKDRQVEKTYLAFVWGRLRHMQGSIDIPLGRSVTDRKKISTRSGKRREAVTRYRVLRQWEQIALLELSPQTGRTHQIRVHLAELGHPVIGDQLYGRGLRRQQQLSEALRQRIMALPHQLLHAASIGFIHPITGKKMLFKAEMRSEMLELMSQLEEGKKP
jgi:pseudouridine synthase, RluA family